MKYFWQAIRPLKSLKNILIFTPLAFKMHSIDLQTITLFSATFFIFSLGTSAVYLINDVFDFETDKIHPRNCQRPFSLKKIKKETSHILAAFLFFLGLFFSFLIGHHVSLFYLSYFVLANGYSLIIKPIKYWDIVFLAGLHILRVALGYHLINELPLKEIFLLILGAFIFLGLLKRWREIRDLKSMGYAMIPGRPYGINDETFLAKILVGFFSLEILGLVLNLVRWDGY